MIIGPFYLLNLSHVFYLLPNYDPHPLFLTSCLLNQTSTTALHLLTTLNLDHTFHVGPSIPPPKLDAYPLISISSPSKTYLPHSSPKSLHLTNIFYLLPSEPDPYPCLLYPFPKARLLPLNPTLTSSLYLLPPNFAPCPAPCPAPYLSQANCICHRYNLVFSS